MYKELPKENAIDVHQERKQHKRLDELERPKDTVKTSARIRRRNILWGDCQRCVAGSTQIKFGTQSQSLVRNSVCQPRVPYINNVGTAGLRV